jgi:hypothetical protein
MFKARQGKRLSPQFGIVYFVLRNIHIFLYTLKLPVISERFSGKLTIVQKRDVT